MYYSDIFYNDTVNGNGFRTTIFVSGCNKFPKCKNCWNEESWDFKAGYKYTNDTENKILESLKKSYVTGLSILGGEPTDNLLDGNLINLVRKCKEMYPDKTIYCWSGYCFEEIIKDELKLEFMQYIDMLRDGEYIEELKDLTQYLQGSRNQRYVDVKESLKYKKVIGYEFKK